MFVPPRFAWSFLSTEIDRTNFDSMAKKFILGLFDPGQFTIEVDQDNSDGGQVAMMTAQVTGLLKNFKLLLPNSNTATFTAYVKKFTSQGAVDQGIRRSGTCGSRVQFLELDVPASFIIVNECGVRTEQIRLGPRLKSYAWHVGTGASRDSWIWSTQVLNSSKVMYSPVSL